MTDVGRTLGGRYQLGDVIGHGGMAEVHAGSDIRLGRNVAIKVLRADLARDPAFLTRFRREAQSAAGLNHPNIVKAYLGMEDTQYVGIYMEYAGDSDAYSYINAKQRLSLREGDARQLVYDVLSALTYTHSLVGGREGMLRKVLL